VRDTNKALFVAANEYTVNVKRKGFILTTLILPLFMVGAMLVPALVIVFSSHGGETIGVVDETGKLFTDMALRYTEIQSSKFTGEGQNKGYSLEKIKDEEEAHRLLQEGNISGYLKIPEDFIESDTAKYVSKSTNILVLEDLGAALRDVRVSVLLQEANLPKEMMKEITRGINIDTFKMTESGVKQESEFSFFKIFLFSYFLIISIFMSGGYLLQGVVEEKEGRIVEVLLSSISARELMVGKILGLGALGLTQMLIWGGGLLVMRYYLQTATPIAIELLPVSVMPFVLVYFLLGYLLFACLYATVGALSTNLRESQQISGAITFPAVMPIMFFFYVMDNPNSPLVNALSHIPFFTPTLMMMRIATTEVPLVDICTTTAVLAFSVYLMARFATKIFRIGILSTGKRPSLAEVIRWMRYE
jgi:ABC-2 type transport system permease protein